MKSLKTDDILGARPRIRHAPKSLLTPRDQRSELQNSGQMYQNPYPMHEYAGYTNKNNLEYNIINHDPNPNDKYNPVKKQLFYLYQKAAKQPNPEHPKYDFKANAEPMPMPINDVKSTSKANQRTNKAHNIPQPSYLQQVSLSQSFLEQSPFPNYKSQNLGQAAHTNQQLKTNEFKYQDNNFGVNTNSRIKRQQRISKQAPFTNYEPFINKNKYNKDTTYTRTYNEQNKQLYKQFEKQMSQMKSKSNNLTRNENSKSNCKTEREYKQLIQESKQIREGNSNQNKRSLSSVSNEVQLNRVQKQQSRQLNSQGQEQSKSLFRGLGYNIVSNNRNSHELQKMENKYINRISRLIQ